MSKKKKRGLVLLVLLLLAGIGTGFYILWNRQETRTVVVGGEEIVINEPLYMDDGETEAIEVPGFDSSYAINKANPTIYLINPENNTVLFQFTLFVNGTQIYQSDYIPPNKMVTPDLYSSLDEGKYNLTIQMDTLDIETLEPCNSVSQETIIQVVK
ncbi:hypothetical protein [Traorella massiliensis]|uniref:hypothetical protein n=1 Tax=Traorella massiliensis TaxID=1903263 RepID=UPI0008F8E8D6|nr:hypothetical protein [Traorella massiliensis]